MVSPTSSSADNTITPPTLAGSSGTDRHLNSRKGRKVYRFSKDPGLHEAMTHYAQTIYNFCRPNRALRVRQSDDRWQRRSPAMAESLTDRIWSVRDLCCRQASPP